MVVCLLIAYKMIIDVESCSSMILFGLNIIRKQKCDPAYSTVVVICTRLGLIEAEKQIDFGSNNWRGIK